MSLHHRQRLAARRWWPLWFALAIGCEPSTEELPSIKIEGALLSYAADGDVCTGTVAEAENWLFEVSAALQVERSRLLPIIYYRIEREEVMARCAGAMACAERREEAVAVYANAVVEKHELVHAIHLSLWDRRPPLLEEGLATLFDDTVAQRLPFWGDAETLAHKIEVEDPRSDHSVYVTGGHLSYWITERYGAGVLLELWDRLERGTSSTEFESYFATITGESLADFLASVNGQHACQIVTCVGEPKPWIDGQWSMKAPAGCDDERVIGISEDSGALYLRQELVQITEPGEYELSSSAEGASIVACGRDCTQLGSGDFLDAPLLPNTTWTVHLNAGLYRVDARSTSDQAGREVRVRLAE